MNKGIKVHDSVKILQSCLESTSICRLQKNNNNQIIASNPYNPLSSNSICNHIIADYLNIGSGVLYRNNVKSSNTVDYSAAASVGNLNLFNTDYVNFGGTISAVNLFTMGATMDGACVLNVISSTIPIRVTNANSSTIISAVGTNTTNNVRNLNRSFLIMNGHLNYNDITNSFVATSFHQSTYNQTTDTLKCITNTFYIDYPNYYLGNMPTTPNANPGYLYKDANGFIKIS